jgi:hypothetical protein
VRAGRWWDRRRELIDEVEGSENRRAGSESVGGVVLDGELAGHGAAAGVEFGVRGAGGVGAIGALPAH